MYFRFFIQWKTENQLKIHFVHLLADENKHIDDLGPICRGFKSEKIKNINSKTITDIIR